jgi:Mg-chelatase subunit ChlD
MGAVKGFFHAFADRTMAYKLKHVISLVYFDDQYVLKCSFTEAFAQFKDLVNRAKPRGMTALYDALIKASDSLIDFGTKYPKCIKRIICLTDGEDNRSIAKPEVAALKIVSNNIILDSFVVGPKSDSLK